MGYFISDNGYKTVAFKGKTYKAKEIAINLDAPVLVVTKELLRVILYFLGEDDEADALYDNVYGYVESEKDLENVIPKMEIILKDRTYWYMDMLEVESMEYDPDPVSIDDVDRSLIKPVIEEEDDWWDDYDPVC